jgi:hypothetical protein
LTERVLASSVSLEVPPPAPLLESLVEQRSGGRRRVSAHLRSARGAELIAVHVPDSSPAEVKLAGLVAWPRHVSGWRVYVWAGPAKAGVDLEIELPDGMPAELLLVDHAYGLPLAGRVLLEARPSSAVSSQLGDVSVVSRRVRL